MGEVIQFRKPRVAGRLKREFNAFHAANSHVYALIHRYTMQVIEAGFVNYSIASIVERVRWHTNIETKRQDGFKIKNGHRAYYARLWMMQNPKHKGFFRLAELRSLREADHDDYEPPNPHEALRRFVKGEA